VRDRHASLQWVVLEIPADKNVQQYKLWKIISDL